LEFNGTFGAKFDTRDALLYLQRPSNRNEVATRKNRAEMEQFRAGGVIPRARARAHTILEKKEKKKKKKRKEKTRKE